jgi:hypothetical protein
MSISRAFRRTTTLISHGASPSELFLLAANETAAPRRRKIQDADVTKAFLAISRRRPIKSWDVPPKKAEDQPDKNRHERRYARILLIFICICS